MSAPDEKHPLRLLFARHGMTVSEGMAYLQTECSPTLLSDLCVWPEDVAPCDVAAVLASDVFGNTSTAGSQ